MTASKAPPLRFAFRLREVLLLAMQSRRQACEMLSPAVASSPAGSMIFGTGRSDGRLRGFRVGGCLGGAGHAVAKGKAEFLVLPEFGTKMCQWTK